MIGDIVKNILLKIKVDTSEASKAAQGIARGGGGLRAGLDLKSIPQHVKAMMDLTSRAEKMGGTWAKALGSLSKESRSFLTDFVQGQKRATDEMVNKLTRAQQQLNRLRDSGASAGRIGRAESLVAGRAGQVNQRFAAAQSAQQFLDEGTASNYSGIAKGVGGAAALAGAVASLVTKSMESSAARAATAGAFMVQRRIDVYKNNMLDAIMNQTDNLDVKAQQQADKIMRGKDIMAAAGIIGGGATAAVGALAELPTAGLSTGLVLGGGAAALAGASHFATREQTRMNEILKAREQLKAQSLAPFVYQNFQDTSAEYARGDRLMRFNQEQSNKFHMNALGNYMDPTEALGLAAGFRPIFGSKSAQGMTTAVQRARISTGFDTDVLTSMIGGQAQFARGGPGGAGNNLSDAVEKGFAGALRDTGSLQGLLQLTGTYQAQQNVRTSTADIAGQIVSGLGPGDVNSQGEADSRALQASSRALAARDALYSKGGFVGFKRMNMAADMATQMGLTGTDALNAIGVISNSKDMQTGLANLQSMGATPEMLSKYKDFTNNAMVSKPGDAELFKKIDAVPKGQPIPEGLMSQAIRSVQMSNPNLLNDPEAARALILQRQNGYDVTATNTDMIDQAKFQAGNAMNVTGAPGTTAASQYTAQGFKSKAMVENQMNDMMKDMPQFMEAFQKQMANSDKLGHSLGLTADAADKLTNVFNKWISSGGGTTSDTKLPAQSTSGNLEAILNNPMGAINH